jgi:hypothetical protein
MRKIFGAVLAIALLVNVGCTVYSEKSKPAWESATGGEHFERLFWDSIKAKNWRDVEAHLSGTVVTQTPDAVRNKQQTMDHVRQLNLTDYSLGEVQTMSNGPDLIVTYTITVHGTFNGQPVHDKPQRMMSIWQQVGKGVVMTVHASMPTAP